MGGKKAALPMIFLPLSCHGSPYIDGLPARFGRLPICRPLPVLHNPLIIQEIVEYEERFQLVFLDYERVGILKWVPGRAQGSFDGSEIPTAPRTVNREVPEHFSREIVSRLEKLLRSVRLNDIAVEIGITRHGWQLIEFVRPPLSWLSHEGVAHRLRCICRLIESNRFR